MSLFGKQRRLPFEDSNIKETEVVNTVSSFKNLRKWNLSLRGTILLVSLIESFLLMFRINGSFTLSLVFIPLVLLLWRGALAFLEHPGIIPLNLLLNSLLVVPLFFIPVVGITPGEFVAFIPLIIGMTVLSSTVSDGRVYFFTADFGTEVLLPLVASMVISAVSYALTFFLFETLLYSVMLICSGLLVAFSSKLLSWVYDKPMILSSEGSFLNSLDWGSRAIVIIDIVLSFGFIYAYKFFTASAGISLPYVIIPLIAVVVVVITMLISSRARMVSFLIEISAVFTIMCLYPSIKGLIAAVIADLLLVLIYIAYKGHRIFAKKNLAIEGLPALMILYSILVMVFEMLMK